MLNFSDCSCKWWIGRKLSCLFTPDVLFGRLSPNMWCLYLMVESNSLLLESGEILLPTNKILWKVCLRISEAKFLSGPLGMLILGSFPLRTQQLCYVKHELQEKFMCSQFGLEQPIDRQNHLPALWVSHLKHLT